VENSFKQSPQQRQPVRPQPGIFNHDHDLVEERIHRFARRRKKQERVAVLLFLPQRVDFRPLTST
jgi:hypothetical protein